MKALGRCNSGMLYGPIGYVIENNVFGNQVIPDSAAFFLRNSVVGRNAAAIAHIAAVFGFENIGQAVGNARHAAVGVAVRIVERLNATAARDVIFRCGDFDVSAVR